MPQKQYLRIIPVIFDLNTIFLSFDDRKVFQASYEKCLVTSMQYESSGCVGFIA